MEAYKDEHSALENCEPCISVIRFINSGIKAMNSRTSDKALKLNSSVEMVIHTFLFISISYKSVKKYIIL